MNLCEDCVKKHDKNKETKIAHHIKSFDLLIPKTKEIKELKDSLNEIKDSIEKLHIIVNNIIHTLNGTIRIFDNYYIIDNNIIEKYKSFKKGEETLKILLI